jgi:hypothetical protein
VADIPRRNMRFYGVAPYNYSDASLSITTLPVYAWLGTQDGEVAYGSVAISTLASESVLETINLAFFEGDPAPDQYSEIFSLASGLMFDFSVMTELNAGYTA